MKPVLLILVVVAATVLAFWILPWLYGLMQKRKKKESLADADEGYSSDRLDPGGHGVDDGTH